MNKSTCFEMFHNAGPIALELDREKCISAPQAASLQSLQALNKGVAPKNLPKPTRAEPVKRKRKDLELAEAVPMPPNSLEQLGLGLP